MTGTNQINFFVTPELTHRSELILHLLEYSNKLVVVKGELDSGKTTFFNELCSQDESNLIIRNLTVTALTNINDIIKAIIDGDQHDELQESQYSQTELNQWLTRCQNKQQIPALLIDNVDLLNENLITQLFSLLKESNQNSVLHICLFCEPSFLEQLEESGINKEDSDSLHIIEMPGLSEKQTEQYIRNNYPASDSTDLNLFDEKTIKQIHRISHGLPGRVNALCEQYLDDPAKDKTENVKNESSNKIKAILIKNKLIISVTLLLMFLSIGIATLLEEAGKKEVKQTIKLDLPKLDEPESKPDDVVEIEVPKELEPEPVTIEELSPPVIPEIAKDLKDKSGVSVYSSEGHLVAQDSDLQTVKEEAEEIPIDNVVESVVPIINTKEEAEEIIETIPEPELKTELVPEPEPEKKPKPRVESKPEPTKSEPISEPVKRDIQWLIKQDSKKYVLQLIGAYERETIEVYIRNFKDNDSKIIPFTASNKGKEWHVLVYGLYEDRDQAVAAIAELPTKAKLMAPWPRTVESIKDLLK
ncbi:MAG: AAA family ATPase [Proteobacteria bacterium]|nr:hypothetical protein [Pseudomonadota bacterium]NOG60401.1 AAA family ATPase [Pseudomonadota bacterium]